MILSLFQMNLLCLFQICCWYVTCYFVLEISDDLEIWTFFCLWTFYVHGFLTCASFLCDAPLISICGPEIFSFPLTCHVVVGLGYVTYDVLCVYLLISTSYAVLYFVTFYLCFWTSDLCSLTFDPDSLTSSSVFLFLVLLLWLYRKGGWHAWTYVEFLRALSFPYQDS